MPTDIEKLRMEVADVDINFPILPDETYEYLLEKHYNSIGKASLDAARIILMHLAQRTDQTVDIFSIKGSKAAEAYRQALMLYIKDPNTNPILQNVQGWVGGVFFDQMQEVLDDTNNNNIVPPNGDSNLRPPSNFFEV
jgi:hypothetical protein